MVARAVDGEFDGRENGTSAGTAEQGSGERSGVRRWRSGGRLLARRATLDPTEGELRVTLVGPDVYRPLALTGLLVAPSVAWLSPGAAVLMLLVTAYGALAVLPGVHYLPVVPSLPDVDGVETVGERATPAGAAAYLVVGAALYAAFGRWGPVHGGVAAGLVFVGLAVAHVGATRHGATSVPAVGVSLAGVVPAVLSGANVLFATTALEAGGGLGWLAVAVSVAVVLDVVFLACCSRIGTELAGTRPSPVRSRRRRVAGLAVLVVANVVLLGATVAGARALTADAGRLSGALAPLGAARPAATAVVSAVLLFPVLVTAAGWCHHLFATAVARLWALVRSTHRPLEGLPDGVSVRVVESTVPAARPLRIPGRRAVLVGQPLAEGLDDDALAAVACHEAYHLVGRDPATGALPWLVGALIGGPNALRVLYDRGAVERAADEFAVDHVGDEALVRAVRGVSRLRVSTRDDVESRGRGRAHHAGGVRGRLTRAVMAPYRLYFGDVALPPHDGVAERVARIRGE